MNFENFADLLKLNKDRGPLEFERFISIAENNNNNKKKNYRNVDVKRTEKKSHDLLSVLAYSLTI